MMEKWGRHSCMSYFQCAYVYISDASVSGHPWYPLECIVVSRRSGRMMRSIGRCSDSVVIVLSALSFGVSGVVGCLHMSVGLKIESGGRSGESHLYVTAYE